MSQSKTGVFIKNGYVVLLSQDSEEFTPHYIERGLYVVSQQPTTPDKYLDGVRQSRIAVNSKHMGCTYNSTDHN